MQDACYSGGRMSSIAPTPSVVIRRATPADAPAAGTICYQAFAAINQAHGFAPELPSAEVGQGLLAMLFSHPGFYGVVAESGGRIIGSNCLDERSTIAGVGPITIDPDAQNQQVGRLLMNAVLDRARERRFPGVRLLQAAFHNRSLSLYTKLGFDTREPISAMQGPAILKQVEGCAVRNVTAADVEACNRLCERVHGHSRAGELSDAVAQGGARLVERYGRITGYASGFGYFAHAVGESNLDLQALISSAAAFEGPGILIPTRNSELFRWCLANGLRVMHPMNLMTVGLYNEPAGAYLPSVLY